MLYLCFSYIAVLTILQLSSAFTFGHHFACRPSGVRLFDNDKGTNRFQDFLLQDGDKSKEAISSSGLSEGMSAKIKSEIVSPFRRFRQFVLFGVLASAGLGSFTAVPQLIIAMTRANSMIPLDQAIQNVAVDLSGMLNLFSFQFIRYCRFLSPAPFYLLFLPLLRFFESHLIYIGVIAAAFFLYNDFTSESKVIEQFTDRELKASGKLTVEESTTRESQLSLLPG